MNKPHKHADLIKLWADGAEIEFRGQVGLEWTDSQGEPAWCETSEYRVMPAPEYAIDDVVVYKGMAYRVRAVGDGAIEVALWVPQSAVMRSHQQT